MAMFVGLDVSLKTTSVCVVEADGTPVWEGKVESEPPSLIKALMRWRATITLVGMGGLGVATLQGSGYGSQAATVAACLVAGALTGWLTYSFVERPMLLWMK